MPAVVAVQRAVATRWLFSRFVGYGLFRVAVEYDPDARWQLATGARLVTGTAWR